MIITAHSGSDNTPDNSLEFVTYVLSLVPDAFEIDVHRRADGTLVIAHDDDASRAYEHCPTLREVCTLAAQNPRIGINYDCKDAGLETDICALHHALCPQNPIYLSGTVSPARFQAERDAFHGAVPLLNAEELIPDFYQRMQAGEAIACAEKLSQICRGCGVRVVNVCYEFCPDPFLDALQSNGLNVSVWTVNDAEKAAHFIAHQVFNITTRHPAQLLRLARP